MFNSYDEIFKAAKQNGKKKMSVACAADGNVIKACYEASEMGIVEAVLTGNKNDIHKILDNLGIEKDYFKIIDSKNDSEAILNAVELVSTNECKFILKGYTQSSDFLKGVLNKEKGLRTGRLLSHTAVIEMKKYNRIVQLTDGGMNIYPDIASKIQILQNAIDLSNHMDIEQPKVAVLGPVEVVNLDIQENLDAAVFSKMAQRKQFGNCVIEGPLAMDLILSKESAKHKKINNEVCGQADIILVPNLVSGNAIVKTMVYMAEIELGGLILGAKAPCLLLSRADTMKTKLNSIALGNVITN